MMLMLMPPALIFCSVIPFFISTLIQFEQVLLAKFCPDDEDGRLFCFTPIKFRITHHFRCRRTPDGHWKAIHATQMIKDRNGNLVGRMQKLVYCHGRTWLFGRRTNWTMKEYTLHTNPPQNVALCEIYSSLKKPNKESDGSLKPIQNQSSLSYSASSKDDVSNFASSQGSPSIHGVSISNSSGVGACSGSVNIDGTGGAGFWSLDEVLSSFSGDDLLSEAELYLPDNWCPDGGGTDIFKFEDTAGSSNWPEFFPEKVNSPKLDTELCNSDIDGTKPDSKM
ncbi:NAC domain-containing protein 69-like isoform X2 [Dioscorea cayenensis subsp. rotundata]|uniref:NAC domain-containing protein 69-like isoform X2 n=1 Tax=Dioscorea cayennensis subsp. rotundata TaxID=55577 RepID=A0AB40CZA5_DIOCR|nr:NAC domain-containing protein 69-like isoform X2 [Dioscorea cayenensis subsp. rotundata]